MTFHAALLAALLAGPAGAASLGYTDYTRLYERLISGQTVSELQDVLPGLPKDLAAAREVSERYWTDSTLRDELAGKDVLPDKVLDALAIRHEVTGGVEHVPAGLMHTYGYLFSQRETAYGRKGKRWVESRLDERLGLPAGTFSPRPPDGEFLSNVTAALAALSGTRVRLARAAKGAPAAKAAGCIEELVRWRRPDGRTEEGVVRTHLVPLAPLPGPAGADTHLLVYELERGGERRFVTAFPIARGFADALMAAKPVVDTAFKPRFNLYVDPSWTVVEHRAAGFRPAAPR